MAMFSDQISGFHQKLQIWAVAQCFGMELQIKLSFTVIFDLFTFLQEKLSKHKHIAMFSDQISRSSPKLTKALTFFSHPQNVQVPEAPWGEGGGSDRPNM